ncbi:TolC family protein [Myxococcota bacterium]|nr:TolC family protein [Myxococcota bacterium]
MIPALVFSLLLVPAPPASPPVPVNQPQPPVPTVVAQPKETSPARKETPPARKETPVPVTAPVPVDPEPVETPPAPVEIPDAAYPVKSISLPEILARAVSHNRGLREAGLKILTSRATIRATSAMFDTQLSANLNGVSQESEFVPGNVFSVTSVKKYSFDAQIARLLPTGGMVALQFSTSRMDQVMTLAMGGPPTEMESKAFTNAFTFVFSHPLLAGFGRDVTTAATQKARIQLDADRLSREAKAQALVRDLVISYWNLWLYWQEQDLLAVSLKVTRSQLGLTKSLLTVGRAKPSDLLAVQNAVAQREGDLMLSRIRILQASLAIKSQLDLPLEEEPLLLRPADKDLPFVAKSLPAELVASVLKRSRDLAMLEKHLELLRQEEKIAREGLLPKLNVTLTAGPTGSSNEYSAAWESLVKFSGFTITGGLSFSWSVEQTQARATLEILDLNAQNLRLQKENLSSGLVMAVMLSREMMQTAQKRVGLARLAVESAEAHLQLENNLFALGRGTNHSVLLRLAELDVARLSQVKAVYDYWTAWVQIQALSGDILNEYQLKLQD